MPCSRHGGIPDSTSSAATASHPVMIRLWRIWPAISSGHHSPKKECSTWIRRERSSIRPKTTGQARSTLPWSGWPHVLVHSERGRANGQVLWLLQQCFTGERQKAGTDDDIPFILEPQRDEETLRRNWERLIQKIYEVDPLACPKCKGPMWVISSIENPSVIRAILEHLQPVALQRGLHPLRG